MQGRRTFFFTVSSWKSRTFHEPLIDDSSSTIVSEMWKTTSLRNIKRGACFWKKKIISFKKKLILFFKRKACPMKMTWLDCVPSYLFFPMPFYTLSKLKIFFLYFYLKYIIRIFLFDSTGKKFDNFNAKQALWSSPMNHSQIQTTENDFRFRHIKY